jgi:hypothetical protein
MEPQPPPTPEPSKRWASVVATAKNIAAIVGFLGGIVGFLGGGLSLKDRWFPPSIEILDLTPIYISEPRSISGSRGASRGVGVILHVKTGNRPVSITGLELEGKRCLSFGEWFGLTETDGKHIDELGAEFNRVKPFQRVLFSGRLADRTSPLVLNIWEESYLPFTFLDPSAVTPGLLVDPKFLGSTENATPLIRRFGLSVVDVFTTMPSAQTTWTAGHLRNEILDGVMTFRLLAGASQSPVPRTAVRPLRRVDVQTWKTSNVSAIFKDHYPQIEIEPSVSGEINCYQQPPK